MDSLMHLIIDHNDRGQAAGSKAASGLKAEMPVKGGFADGNSQLIFKGLQ
jgi:hypothetical protein